MIHLTFISAIAIDYLIPVEIISIAISLETITRFIDEQRESGDGFHFLF